MDKKKLGLVLGVAVANHYPIYEHSRPGTGQGRPVWLLP